MADLQTAATEGDRDTIGALLEVLRCRTQTVALWKRFATGMEAYAALVDGTAEDAVSLVEHMESSTSGAAATARREQDAPPSRGPRGEVGKAKGNRAGRRKAQRKGSGKGKRRK